MNADFSLSPGLARKVTWTDNRTLVLDLRPDVRFWDSSPMTPEDVIHSLERQRDPRTQALYGNHLAAVTSIKATGPDQVTLRTKGYDQTLPKALSTSFGAVNQKAYTGEGRPRLRDRQGRLDVYRAASWAPGSPATASPWSATTATGTPS
ncbi:hypothetical protein SALBM135S_07470 [Streptomyces alboniger]